MSDLERYIKKRKGRDPEFAEGFEAGYSNFKFGLLLRQARERAGMTLVPGLRFCNSTGNSRNCRIAGPAPHGIED